MNLLVIVLQIVVVVLLPVLVGHAAKAVEGLVANKDFKAIPALGLLSQSAGWLIGFALIYANLDRAYFDLEIIFLRDSPWNIGCGDFLLHRGNIFAYELTPVFELLQAPEKHPLLLALTGIGAVLPAFCITIAFRLWPKRDAWRALGACAIVALSAAWLTIYLVALLFWSLYLLNFWTLAIVAAYYQYRRYRQE